MTLSCVKHPGCKFSCSRGIFFSHILILWLLLKSRTELPKSTSAGTSSQHHAAPTPTQSCWTSGPQHRPCGCLTLASGASHTEPLLPVSTHLFFFNFTFALRMPQWSHRDNYGHESLPGAFAIFIRDDGPMSPSSEHTIMHCRLGYSLFTSVKITMSRNVYTSVKAGALCQGQVSGPWPIIHHQWL